MNVLKIIKPLDWVILVLAGYLLIFDMDYANLSIIDQVYVVSLAIWLVLFIGRIIIESKKQRDADGS